MAQLRLSESPWRMLRRLVVSGKKRAPFSTLRNMTRHDRRNLDMLIRLGMVVEDGQDADGETLYSLTAVGRATAHLGEYEVKTAAELAARAPAEPAASA